jgi:glycosyltransferase involved in cell wall biosynthesis
MQKTLSIIAPCLNEEENIEIFYERIKKTLNKIDAKYKIYFIDDGSEDNTWQIIKKLSSLDNNILAIKLSRNFGHQNAICAGIDKANSDFVAFLDVDLQDPPELIEDMYNKIISNNLNIIFAQRSTSKENFLKKLLLNYFIKFLIIYLK